MAKIEGTVSDDCRILVYDTNDGSLEVDQLVSTGSYSFLQLTDYNKHVTAIRQSDGKALAYGDVPPVPSPDPVNITFYVTDDLDDAYCRAPDKMFRSVTYILFGYGGGNTYKCYTRFLNVGIPVGSIINNAYVRFRNDASANGSVTINVACEDVDNAARPGSSSVANWNEFNNRPLTSSSVPWSFSTSTGGANVDTPNIKSAVQEVIDRPGWSFNNALNVIYSYTSGGYTHLASVTNTTWDGPEIHINYTAW